jgi:flavin-dependent dehydrogenase
MVLGGGPAGAATALTLARHGCSVAVAEQSDYAGDRPGEALPPAIQPLLVKLGVWERFLEQKPAPSFGVRSAWGSAELLSQDFIFSPYGSGWHVARNRFDALLARCAAEAGAQLYTSVAEAQIVEKNGAWQIDLSTDGKRRRFRAALIVDATGRRATFARKHGVRRIMFDSLIGASVIFPARDSTPSGFTLIEAVENGWWYSSVLPDGRLIVVYMTDGDIYASVRKGGWHERDGRNGRDGWRAQLDLTRNTRSRIDLRDLVIPEVRLAAANTSRLDRVSGPNWLAVGDAAMAFDPLSGQGIYKAIQFGIQAAESILRRNGHGDAPFQQYEDSIARSYTAYMSSWYQFYSRERRWQNAPFWQRRNLAADFRR